MRPRVLVLSRNYPNGAIPHLGLWVERLVRHLRSHCDLHVVAPVPFVPPLPRVLAYAQYRGIPVRESRAGIPVDHPRFLIGPGYSLHSVEADLYSIGIASHVRRVREAFPFDLIHAHFTYPDGVAAARLGHRYAVPVVITEHAPWGPWMSRFPRVRRQAAWAVGQSRMLIAVSRYVLEGIRAVVGEVAHSQVIPLGVDGSVFAPRDGERGASHRILYVGRIHSIKGVDVLLEAMRRLLPRNPDLRLHIVGGSFIYRHQQREEQRIRLLTDRMGLRDVVVFEGVKSAEDVAAAMRGSALLVLPSRAETFGVVLVEALACGLPVVATRSGGPEEIVNDDVGVLVPPEDPDALAGAITDVLRRRASFPVDRLRAYALQRFGWDAIAARTAEVFHRALAARVSAAPIPRASARSNDKASSFE